MAPGARYLPCPVHSDLSEGFSDPVRPAHFPKTVLRYRNQRAAARVGLDTLSESEWIRHFAKFEPLPDNIPEPLAMRYHGHQFQNYNPDIGDGRGFLFAQMRDAADGRVLDLGTKGSGRTPYSRDGDGRLTLKGGLREVLATEMLETLGVSTSKTFSVIETGEPLFRPDEPSPTRSCVLVRQQHSHIRFGTFQRHAHEGSKARLHELLEHSVQHYLPDAQDESQGDLPTRFFAAVVQRAAPLAASWMNAGFVHGVLNTDNMNITGESFDYGPYRFLPEYDPAFVAAYFDQSGLYAFGQQPQAVLWNLGQLAQAIQSVSPSTDFTPLLEAYRPAFASAFVEGCLQRLGIKALDSFRDNDLVQALYRYLDAKHPPYDAFFHHWFGGIARRDFALQSSGAAYYEGAEFEAFLKAVEDFEPLSPQQLSDPYFERAEPCSMLIDEIEAIWDKIATEDDWSDFEAKIADIDVRREAEAGAFEDPEDFEV